VFQVHYTLNGKAPAVMNELRTVNFNGLVAVEYEKDGNSNEDMQYLVDYARRLA